MRTGAAILVKILRKCALRETHARAPDRSCAHRRRTRRPLTAYSVLGSTPSWPEVATPHSHKGASLDAVSAFDLSGHEPADAGGHADRKQRLDSEQHRSLRGHSSTAPLLILPGTAFTSSTLRAINTHVAVAYSSGLVF
jgi:hypothetical protein